MSKDEAEDNLLKLEEKWGKRYPIVINSWQDKMGESIALFQLPKRDSKNNV